MSYAVFEDVNNLGVIRSAAEKARRRALAEKARAAEIAKNPTAEAERRYGGILNLLKKPTNKIHLGFLEKNWKEFLPYSQYIDSKRIGEAYRAIIRFRYDTKLHHGEVKLSYEQAVKEADEKAIAIGKEFQRLYTGFMNYADSRTPRISWQSRVDSEYRNLKTFIANAPKNIAFPLGQLEAIEIKFRTFPAKAGAYEEKLMQLEREKIAEREKIVEAERLAAEQKMKEAEEAIQAAKEGIEVEPIPREAVKPVPVEVTPVPTVTEAVTVPKPVSEFMERIKVFLDKKYQIGKVQISGRHIAFGGIVGIIVLIVLMTDKGKGKKKKRG